MTKVTFVPILCIICKAGGVVLVKFDSSYSFIKMLMSSILVRIKPAYFRDYKKVFTVKILNRWCTHKDINKI